jgi:hypothetical protein
VYGPTWAGEAGEDALLGVDSRRMVAPLSVRQRGTTHMAPRLDLYRSLSWRFVCMSNFCREIKSGITGRASNRDPQGHEAIRQDLLAVPLNFHDR